MQTFDQNFLLLAEHITYKHCVIFFTAIYEQMK